MAWDNEIYHSIIKRRDGAVVRVLNTKKGIRFALKDIATICGCYTSTYSNSYTSLRTKYNFKTERGSVPIVDLPKRYVSALVVDQETALRIVQGECDDEDLKKWLIQEVIMLNDFHNEADEKNKRFVTKEDKFKLFAVLHEKFRDDSAAGNQWYSDILKSFGLKNGEQIPESIFKKILEAAINIKMPEKNIIPPKEEPKHAAATPPIAPSGKVTEVVKPNLRNSIMDRIDAMLVELLELKHSLRDMAVM